MSRTHQATMDLPEELLFSFGEWVSQRRKVIRMTQREVADLVGCSLVLIQKIEADQRRPSTQIAERLARVLHVAPLEHPAFIRCARGELAADRLPPPVRGVASPSTPRALVPNPRSGGNLPAAVSSFIGRTRELAALHGLIGRADVRLVTLTGAGGSGKTRLALEAVRALQADVPDGMWFVDLAPISDPLHVLRTIMQTLGVAEDANVAPRESLMRWIRPRRMLLLIDNCEHLLAAAPLISDLLRSAALLKVVVTSRVALRLQGEHEYLVAPLGTPRGEQREYSQEFLQYDAVQLFVTRTQERRPDAGWIDASLPVIANICRVLEGMPLAIELAAARMQVLSPALLLAGLQQAVLPLLTHGARDLPARQQTLRATIMWSYELLDASHQRLLARLGVFVGGWTAAAAAAICGDDQLDVLGGLEALVEHSLIRVTTSAEEPRFSMLETVREFALERLRESGEQESLRESHAAYYVALAQRIHTNWWRPPDSTAVAAFDREVDNLRAVLRWSRAKDSTPIPMRPAEETLPETRLTPLSMGMQLMVTTHQYWEIHAGRMEGHQWLEALYARADELPLSLRLKGALAVCELRKFYDLHSAQALIYTVKPWIWQSHDPQLRLCFQCSAGWIEMFGQASDVAEVQWSIGLGLARVQGDTHWIAEFLSNLGLVGHILGKAEHAEQLLRESVRLAQTIGYHYQLGEALLWLALVMIDRGDQRQAYTFASECVAVTRQAGNRRTRAIALETVGYLLLEQGDLLEGEKALQEALDLTRIQGNSACMARTLYYLGRLRFHEGNLEYAAPLIQESELLGKQYRNSEMRLETSLTLGWIHVAWGDLHQAALCYQSSLRAVQLEAHPVRVAVVIEAVASLTVQCDDALLAARLWSAALTLREAYLSAPGPADRRMQLTALVVARSAFNIEQIGRELSRVTGIRATLGDSAFDAAWEAGRALTWEQAADEALHWLQEHLQ